MLSPLLIINEKKGNMKYIVQKLVFSILLIGSFGVFAQESQTTARLIINVVDAQSNRPINEASVKVEPLLNSRVIEEKTIDGEFSEELVLGQYAAVISHPNYQTTRVPRLIVEVNKVNFIDIYLTAKSQEVENIQVFADQSVAQNIASAGARYLDRESLRSATGSGGDILRALDGLAGLFSSGEFASFTVRGSGPRDNLIFVDGFPFQNIVHFGDSFGEQEDIEGGGRYSIFAPNIINGAEFQPGGWSAAYGGKAGSLLSLDVASGNTKQASYTGLFDFAGFELGYEGPNPAVDDGSMLVSIRSQDFGRLFELIGLEDIGSPKNTDIIFKTSTELNQDNSLDTLFIYAPEEYTRDLDNALASDEDDPGNYEDLELSTTETENMLLGLTLTTLTGETGVWENRLYYRLFDEDGRFGEAYPDLVPDDTSAQNVPVREGVLTSKSKQTEIGFRSDYSYLNDFGKFSAGARVAHVDLDYAITLTDDWIRYEYDAQDAPEDPNLRYIVLTPELTNNMYSASETLSSIYAEQVFDYDDLDFRIGLRAENDGFASQTELLPRVGLEWYVSDKMNLSATAGRYTQSIRYSDRAFDPNNNDLENEIVDSFSVGLTYQVAANWQILLEPYYQRLSNLMVETDGIANTFDNSGEGRSFGIDTALIRRFEDGWSLNAQYSYNKAEIKDSPSLDYYDADFNRPHIFSLGGLWDINEKWSVSARFKFASGAPRDGFVIYEDVLGNVPVVGNIRALRFSKENTSKNTDRFDSFNSLNFRVDYRTQYRGLAVNMFLDVINAYGADNPSSAEFNERTGVDVIEDGEVFPFLGIRVTF